MTKKTPSANESIRLPGRPKAEEVPEMERQLLNAALDEFSANGFAGASMSRIAVVAGISKTTLYSRYVSKEEIFHAIVNQQHTLISPEALKSASGVPDLETGLRAYANLVLDLSMNRQILALNRLIYSESDRFPELAAAAAEKTRQGIKRISQFIQDCAKASGARCRDPDSAAEAFVYMLRGWYVDILLTNRRMTAPQRKDWVNRTVRIIILSSGEW